MTHRVRDYVEATKRNAKLAAPLPPETRASGPGPTLVDVFQRHPRWKRRLIKELKRNDYCENGHPRWQYGKKIFKTRGVGPDRYAGITWRCLECDRLLAAKYRRKKPS